MSASKQFIDTVYFLSRWETGMNLCCEVRVRETQAVSPCCLCSLLSFSADMMNRSFCIWERICSEAVSYSVRCIPDTDCLSKEIAQHVTYVFLYCFSLLEIWACKEAQKCSVWKEVERQRITLGLSFDNTQTSTPFCSYPAKRDDGQVRGCFL